MRFEEAYKNWLKSELATATSRTVTASNDFQHKILKDNPEAIAMIVNGGNAPLSKAKEFDYNTLNLQVMFVCQANYKNELIDKLNSIAKLYNMINQTMVAPVVNYRANYSTAFAVGGDYDMYTNKGTIKACTVSMSITIWYGANAYLDLPTFKLVVGTTEYDINYIAEYNMASAPSQEAYLPLNQDYSEQNNVARTNVFVFVLYTVKSGLDNLQDILENELKAKSTGLYGKALSLKWGSDTIAIKSYQLSLVYQNGSAGYNLTLSV